MNRKSFWRPEVKEYYRYAAQVRKDVLGDEEAKIPLGTGEVLYIFYTVQVPESYPESRRRKMYGLPCGVRPDADNVAKGIMDALYERDSIVSCLHVEKFYCKEGEQPHIEISVCDRSSLEHS